MHIDILWQIADHVAPSPVEYCRLAAVNKTFYRVFTSDRLWKKQNPYGLESGIYAKFQESTIPERGMIKATFARLEHKSFRYMKEDSLDADTILSLGANKYVRAAMLAISGIVYARDSRESGDILASDYNLLMCVAHIQPRIFYEASEEIKMRPEFYKLCYRYELDILGEEESFNYDLINNKEFVLWFFRGCMFHPKRTAALYGDLPPELQDDPDVIEATLKHHPWTLLYVSPEVAAPYITEDLVHFFLLEEGAYFLSRHKEFANRVTDSLIQDAAYYYDEPLLKYCGDVVRSHPEICGRAYAVDQDNKEFIPPSVIENALFFEAIVAQLHHTEYASLALESLKISLPRLLKVAMDEQRELPYLTAYVQYMNVIEEASKTPPGCSPEIAQVVECAVDQGLTLHSLDSIKDSIRDNKHLVLKLLKQNALFYEELPISLKCDADVLRAYIHGEDSKICANALPKKLLFEMLPQSLRDDEALIKKIFSDKSISVAHAPTNDPVIFEHILCKSADPLSLMDDLLTIEKKHIKLFAPVVAKLTSTGKISQSRCDIWAYLRSHFPHLLSDWDFIFPLVSEYGTNDSNLLANPLIAALSVRADCTTYKRIPQHLQHEPWHARIMVALNPVLYTILHPDMMLNTEVQAAVVTMSPQDALWEVKAECSTQLGLFERFLS